jgi:hypothetical protein
MMIGNVILLATALFRRENAWLWTGHLVDACSFRQILKIFMILMVTIHGHILIHTGPMKAFRQFEYTTRVGRLLAHTEKDMFHRCFTGKRN